MKIPSRHRGRSQDGMAVIAVVAILAILLVFIAGNLRTLHLLRNDLRLIEKQQTSRLASAGVLTNSLPVTETNSAPGEFIAGPAPQPPK